MLLALLARLARREYKGLLARPGLPALWVPQARRGSRGFKVMWGRLARLVRRVWLEPLAPLVLIQLFLVRPGPLDLLGRLVLLGLLARRDRRVPLVLLELRALPGLPVRSGPQVRLVLPGRLALPAQRGLRALPGIRF